MNRFGQLFAAVFLASFAVGCKHRDDEVVGKWKNAAGTIYTFQADKTFTRANSAGNATGTWTISGDKVSTVVDKVNQASYKEKIETEYRNAKSLLPPDLVTIRSRADFTLNAEGNNMTHRNATTGKDVIYNKL